MVRAVFPLAPHLVIQNAVLVRLHVLAALEIEGQKNGGALAARPTDQMVVVVFLEHGVSLKWLDGCRFASAGGQLHPKAGRRRLLGKISSDLSFHGLNRTCRIAKLGVTHP